MTEESPRIAEILADNARRPGARLADLPWLTYDQKNMLWMAAMAIAAVAVIMLTARAWPYISAGLIAPARRKLGRLRAWWLAP